MTETGGEKKHPASPNRRRRAREAGKVAKSQDLSSAVVLLAGVLLLWWSGPQLMQALTSMLHESLTANVDLKLDSQTASLLFASAANKCLRALLPLMAGVCGVALLNNWLQAGRIVKPQGLSLDWERVLPHRGAAELLSTKNATKLGFGMVKAIAVVSVASLAFCSQWKSLNTTDLPLTELFVLVWDTTLFVCVQIAFVLLALSIADYGYQWWSFEQALRMTDEELKEDTKESEGDPRVKQQRNELRRRMASQSL